MIRTFTHDDLMTAIGWRVELSHTKADGERLKAAITCLKTMMDGCRKWTLKTDHLPVKGRTATYTVNMSGQFLTCTCKGYTKGHRDCYHILVGELICRAAMLYRHRTHPTNPQTAVAELTA